MALKKVRRDQKVDANGNVVSKPTAPKKAKNNEENDSPETKRRRIVGKKPPAPRCE